MLSVNNSVNFRINSITANVDELFVFSIYPKKEKKIEQWKRMEKKKWKEHKKERKMFDSTYPFDSFAPFGNFDVCRCLVFGQ